MPTRLSPEGGHGFIVTWLRLVILLAIVASLSSIFTTILLSSLVSDKASSAALTEAFRKGCERNVGTVGDITRIAKAEISYKSAVLRAVSVKSDVKDAAVQALRAYRVGLPGLQRRLIRCDLAFPSHGKPRIVRIK